MSKRLVVVDDSLTLIKKLAGFLEETMGFQVVATGTDGNQAVELYRKHRPDLITLDLTMPNKDGQAALEEILGEFPEARVMIISAIRGPEMTKCLKIGAKGYVEKPLRFQDPQFLRDFTESLQEALGP